MCIRDRYSWETWLSESLALLNFIAWSYKERKSTFIPKVIAFINNVFEVNRASEVLRQAIHLGSPLDNLCIRRFSETDVCKDHISYPQNFKHYYIYAPETVRNFIITKLRKEGNEATLREVLEGTHAIIYSAISLDRRSKIFEDFSNMRGNTYLILSTSSLELGVDYPHVTLIINIGPDNPASIIQRIGRGGRSEDTLWTVLGIMVARNNPLDYRFMNYRNMKSVIEQDVSTYEIKVSDLKSLKILATFMAAFAFGVINSCLLYTSPSPRDLSTSRMPSSA